MILALKTAGATTEIHLVASNGKISTYTWDSGRTLADQLLGRIKDRLADHKADLSDLTGIVILSGPGSFTSLRIGHTVANALADSLGIPVVSADNEKWLNRGIKVLHTAKPGHPVLPQYGADAHITRQQPPQTSKA